MKKSFYTNLSNNDVVAIVTAVNEYNKSELVSHADAKISLTNTLVNAEYNGVNKVLSSINTKYKALARTESEFVKIF